MVNRCRARTLIRAVGIATGLAICTPAVLADEGILPRIQEQNLDRNAVIGGDPEEVIAVGVGGPSRGAGNPLTSPVCSVDPANCQDRERIDGPAFRLGIGVQNMVQFKRFDEFRLSADGFVKEVCFRIEYLFAVTCAATLDDPADPDCPTPCDPMVDPDCDGICGQLLDPAIHAEFLTRFQVTIWDDFLGLPSTIVAGPYRRDFGVPGAQDDNTQVPIAGGLNVTQALTGDTIGFNTPTFFEYGINAAIPAADQVLLFASQCYWMEIDQATGGCFALMSGSPEAETGTANTGPGNMRSLVFDATIRQFVDPALDFRAYDIHMCINAEDASGAVGSGLVVSLLDTNDETGFDFDACSTKTVPANDLPSDALVLSCGQTESNFDNTWADWQSAFVEGGCRKQIAEDGPDSRGDMWYAFKATELDPLDPSTASAIIGACSTNQLQGEGGGDALLQIYALDPTGPNVVDPFTLPSTITTADVFEIGCSDDACGNLPEICLTNLQINAWFIVRLHSYRYTTAGLYTLSLNCPCPFIENDTCATAFDVPLVGPGFTEPLGILISGNTSNGNLENTPSGCESTLRIEDRNGSNQMIADTAWYKLAGQGALIQLNTDQQFFGQDYNTALSIFCSEDNTCDALACIGSNDNIDAQTLLFKSDAIFCGVLGKTYYIAVGGGARFGAPTEAGDFGMLVKQLNDSAVNPSPVACCANGNQCVNQTVYELPPNVLAETSGLNPGAAAESCDDGDPATPPFQPQPDISGENNGCAGPPNLAGNFGTRFGKFVVGQAVSGSLFSHNGGRDTDEWLFEGINPNGDETIVDWSWQGEGAIRNRVEPVFSNWFNCPGLALGCYSQNHDFGEERSNQRTHHEAWMSRDNQGIDFGNPGFVGTMSFTFRQRSPGQGTPCGVRDRYWFKLNEAFDAELCAAVASPIGVETTDNVFPNNLNGEVTFGDYDNERWQPTFGDPLHTGLTDATFGFASGTSSTGKCGSTCNVAFDTNQGVAAVCNGAGDFVDIFAGENCETRKVGAFCVADRDLSGCFFPNPVDGDFSLLRPNVPMVGFVDGVLGFSGINRDIDFYKFRIGTDADAAAGLQFAVTLDIQSGHAMQAFIQENNCANDVFDTIPYGTSATTGNCGSRTLIANDVMILTAGVYVVQVLWGDLFGFSGVCVFDNLPCSFSGDPLNDPAGASKYLLNVTAEPLPACSVDTSGAVQKVAEAFEGCPTGVNPLPEERPSNCPGEGNDGCAVGTFQSDVIASGETVWGQLFTLYEDANSQQSWLTDIDNYSFSVPAGEIRRVSYSMVADGPVIAAILNVGANGSLCNADNPNKQRGGPNQPRGGVRVLGPIAADACNAASPGPGGQVFLTEGDYAISVVPGILGFGLAGEDLNCTTNSQLTYTLSVTMGVIGACCDGDACSQTTVTECNAPVFKPNEACLAPFASVGSGSAFSDISGVGTLVVFGGVQDRGTNFVALGNDLGIAGGLQPSLVSMALGGTFNGHSSIGVSDNGYLVLGATPSNNSVPSVLGSGDANVVAPLFHDWDADQSSVYVLTDLNSTTVQWSSKSNSGFVTGVVRATADDATDPDCGCVDPPPPADPICNPALADGFCGQVAAASPGAASSGYSAEFQVVLDHASGNMEFRYGAMADNDISSLTAASLATLAASKQGDFHAGVSDDSGNNGLNLAIGGILGGNTSLSLLQGGVACSVPCCLGNAAKESPGEVNFTDITQVLGNWLKVYAVTGDGDSNCDGVVNFSDITSVLSNWLNVCP